MTEIIADFQQGKGKIRARRLEGHIPAPANHRSGSSHSVNHTVRKSFVDPASSVVLDGVFFPHPQSSVGYDARRVAHSGAPPVAVRARHTPPAAPAAS